MLPPTHAYLENTVPSIAAALRYGADIVEIDIHPTSDGEFVVFHDWTLECRTDGEGETRSRPLSYLKSLDVGYGYTSDGGKTYPFRGRFKGAMPTFLEVLEAFPNTRFLVNVKGGTSAEADLILRYLDARRANWDRLMFYGGEATMARLRDLRPDAVTTDQRRLKACLTGYVLTGSVSRIPPDCSRSVVFLPSNYRQLMWGWPNLFVDRMRSVGSEVFLIGPFEENTAVSGTTAVDDPDLARALAAGGYNGGISTDRIDLIGPALSREGRSSPK
jgi:glycerophosphoryl diester phosphodiesterase